MPVLARFYGLKPWELAEMSHAEIEAFLDALPD